jgi:hypothetical protein
MRERPLHTKACEPIDHATIDHAPTDHAPTDHATIVHATAAANDAKRSPGSA